MTATAGVSIMLLSLLPLIMLIFKASAKDLTGGMLYPRESETREIKSLNGVWNFRLSIPSDSLNGFREKWYLSDLRDTIPMNVPASYNDITTERWIRDHVGLVWYDRIFFVSPSWRENKRVWLRFGSVSYAAQVWINGELVTSHEVGHLPFQAEITRYLRFDDKNRITVAVDNTLTQTTVPQGVIDEQIVQNKSKIYQSYTFDFFNYAGIDRPVLLYTTPVEYIDDITINTNIENNQGIVYYKVAVKGLANTNTSIFARISLFNKNNTIVASSRSLSGKLTVDSPHLWWPYLMDPNPGYLYSFKVEISVGNKSGKDIYRLPIGIRVIKWSSRSLTINGKPIYIRGFGKHEDFFIKGKGLDLSVALRDTNLIKWIGANTYRTSHYPYAEEIMDLADQTGIMIIDECPSVDTIIYSSTLLQKHKDSLSELIRRDKNRPSVIMWSAANEPRTQVDNADPYFKNVIKHIKSLDNTRPTTIALSRGYNEDKVGQHLDIIGFNRYNSWYSDTGKTEVIYDNVINEAERWYTKYNKPVIMTEYGADTYSGLHALPDFVWTEEYQVTVMSEHFKAFDELRRRGYFIGEMIWNFADFMTSQSITRVVGNKKGIFTRDRQPKMSAHHLRKRYWALANEQNNVPLPKDLAKYISWPNKSINRTEL